MTRNRTARAALLAVACGLSFATAAGTAAAAPGEEEAAPPETAAAALCDDGTLCAWPERAYAGERTTIGDGAVGECRELPAGAVSAINDTALTAVFYASEGCVGGVVVGVEPGRKTPGFTEALSVRLRTPGAPVAPGTAPTEPGTEPSGTTDAPAQEGATADAPAEDAPAQ